MTLNTDVPHPSFIGEGFSFVVYEGFWYYSSTLTFSR